MPYHLHSTNSHHITLVKFAQEKKINDNAIFDKANVKMTTVIAFMITDLFNKALPISIQRYII